MMRMGMEAFFFFALTSRAFPLRRIGTRDEILQHVQYLKRQCVLLPPTYLLPIPIGCV